MRDKLQQMMKTGRACHDVQEFLSFFANRSRLRILCCLCMEERSVADLAEATELRQSLVSQNLKSLRLAGMVERRREGNRSIYSVSNPLVFETMEFLSDLAPRLVEDDHG